ncbi:hypothetical protein WR25_00480 [Diploscapter pachys]|uniref:Uncharacterized protein n=1 Tax=Diploscapter pachys TaxID=2018661 RepID=A0A2A2KJE2_9BILA|nr:hypothetical protein WR25_00480 [Diploscapter pachys]
MPAPHQVITGALNKGENVYAIGSVEGATFIACAVGSDVVILGADFSRVQIIPGNSNHVQQLVTSVSCCSDSGKIAATYGNVIRILEPSIAPNNQENHKGHSIYQYQWIETQCFTVKGHVSTVLWNMDGLRMVVVIKDELFLYQHRSISYMSKVGTSAPVMFCIAEEEQSNDATSWDIIWCARLAQAPQYIKFSPDGTFLATAGGDDCIVKIFYQDSHDGEPSREVTFSYVTLHHPAPVRGFEWRRTGRYMPHKCIQSVLLTWCIDNTSRIWKETPPPELAIIDLTGDGGEPAWEQQRPRKILGKQVRLKKARNKIMAKFRHMIPEKRRKDDNVQATALGLRAQIGRTSSFSDLHTANYANVNVQFHLAATINSESDVLLVPSMENSTSKQAPLCVHWLNNKELVFSIGAEKLLAEALLSEEHSKGNLFFTIKMEIFVKNKK